MSRQRHVEPNNRIVSNMYGRISRPWCSLRWCYLKQTLSSILWIIIIIVDLATGQPEYCQFENFNASCEARQIIMMKQARYGRMQFGRCVSKSYGHIGCAANVLELIDKDCSGLRKCIFNIPALRDVIQPCPKDLTVYLEAQYICIDVMKYRHNECNKSIQLTAKNSSVYISSDPRQAKDNQVTAIRCPIMVHALPGQKINFTMYRFGLQNNIIESTASICQLKASFTETGGGGRDVSECDLSQRQQVVYTSTSTSVTVYFHNQRALDDDEEMTNRVLLKVEAVGCPNLEVPPNAWVERQGDKSIVKCNYTHETWYVTCTGTTWTGHVTNCTPATPNGDGTHTLPRKGHIPLGLVVAVTIGVILGVMFGIAMLITVFVYRRKRKSPKASKTTSLLGSTGGDEASQDNDENYSRRVWIEHKHDDPYGRICHGHNTPLQYSSSNTDYSHMFELQCSARAHGLAPGGDCHVDSPYGQCRRQVAGGRVTADDIHTCAMPFSALTSGSANSPSFATFKATDRSSLDRSPNKTLKQNKPPRPEPRNLQSLGNKNRSLSSVAEVDDITSPEHQPDLVTSNNSDRIAGIVFNERPRTE